MIKKNSSERQASYVHNMARNTIWYVILHNELLEDNNFKAFYDKIFEIFMIRSAQLSNEVLNDEFIKINTYILSMEPRCFPEKVEMLRDEVLCFYNTYKDKI